MEHGALKTNERREKVHTAQTKKTLNPMKPHNEAKETLMKNVELSHY